MRKFYEFDNRKYPSNKDPYHTETVKYNPPQLPNFFHFLSKDDDRKKKNFNFEKTYLGELLCLTLIPS